LCCFSIGDLSRIFGHLTYRFSIFDSTLSLQFWFTSSLTPYNPGIKSSLHAVYPFMSTPSWIDLMPTKSLVIAAIVTFKFSLSGYGAVAASPAQADVAVAEQLGGRKAPSSLTLVRGGGGGGHGGFGGGGFSGHGFGGGFGGRLAGAVLVAVASDVVGMAGTGGTAATTPITATSGG
jgi:hypothetical protein